MYLNPIYFANDFYKSTEFSIKANTALSETKSMFYQQFGLNICFELELLCRTFGEIENWHLENFKRSSLHLKGRKFTIRASMRPTEIENSFSRNTGLIVNFSSNKSRLLALLDKDLTLGQMERTVN